MADLSSTALIDGMPLSAGIAGLLALLVLITVARLLRAVRAPRPQPAGEPAPAVVLERSDVGAAPGGLQVELLLDVLPLGRPPFQATVRAVIPRPRQGRVQPGVQVQVLLDPSDPRSVTLAADSTAG